MRIRQTKGLVLSQEQTSDGQTIYKISKKIWMSCFTTTDESAAKLVYTIMLTAKEELYNAKQNAKQK